MFGRLFNFSPFEKEVKDNCARIVEKIRQYIRDRKSGKRKSSVSNNSDLLSLFLKDPDVFNEDSMIYELIDLIVAGSLTSQYTNLVILGHIATDPESRDKLRQEFSQFRTDYQQEHPECKDLDNLSFINKVLNGENSQDLEWTNNVIMEALRINPPAAMGGN